jgi:hypothetical protein
MLGPWLDWTTQQWVKKTGRRLDARTESWLDGPAGGPYIGDRWLAPYAESVDAEVVHAITGGLLESMAALNQPGFSADLLHPRVVEFYEATSDWRLEVWSRWSACLRPLGLALAGLFARRLQQLNLPLDPMETSRGMTSEVKPVVARDGSHLGTAWQRTLRANGQTVFGGYYGVVTLPTSKYPSIRVVFPLPNGSVTVFLRPENSGDGGLRLRSGGASWGETGAYLVVRGHDDELWSRRVPLPERFEVFVDDEGVLRAEHYLRFLNWPVLHLHYRMEHETHREQ